MMEMFYILHWVEDMWPYATIKLIELNILDLSILLHVNYASLKYTYTLCKYIPLINRQKGSEIIYEGHQHLRTPNYFYMELVTPLANYVTVETKHCKRQSEPTN